MPTGLLTDILQVAGPLMGYVVERISVGIQHVAALASPADRRTGLAQVLPCLRSTTLGAYKHAMVT